MPAERRVLVLDNALYPDAYRPFEHWRVALGDAVSLERVTRADPLPALEGFSHLIVSGSEASIVDDDPWVAPQMALILEALDRGLAVLGSCHGHQMVARALGGTVGRSETPELGWVSIQVDPGSSMFDGLNGEQWVFVSHFDEVLELPREVQVTARSSRCAIHAFCHRRLPVWGVQSHPEINPGEGQFILERFAELDPRVAAAKIDRPARDSQLLKPLVQRFLDLGGDL